MAEDEDVCWRILREFGEYSRADNPIGPIRIVAARALSAPCGNRATKPSPVNWLMKPLLAEISGSIFCRYSLS